MVLIYVFKFFYTNLVVQDVKVQLLVRKAVFHCLIILHNYCIYLKWLYTSYPEAALQFGNFAIIERDVTRVALQSEWKYIPYFHVKWPHSLIELKKVFFIYLEKDHRVTTLPTININAKVFKINNLLHEKLHNTLKFQEPRAPK